MLVSNGFTNSTLLLGSFGAMKQYADYFNLDTQTQALNNAILYVGGFVGFVYSGWFCDKYGRKWCMAFGAIVTLVGVLLQSAAVAEAMFVIGRFLIGNGLTVTAVAAPVYVGEMAHPDNRGFGTSIYNGAWYVGSLIAAGICLGTLGISNGEWMWRIPSIIQAVPSALCIMFLAFIPESPRWLVSKGREEEAFEILVKYHGNGDPNDLLVLAEFQEIKDTLKFEATNTQSWKSLVSTPGNRKRTWINVSSGTLSQFVGSNIATYYIAQVLTDAGYQNATTQLTINTLLSLFNLCCAVAGTLSVDRIGRRWMFLLGTGSSAVWLTITGVLTKYYGTNDTNPSGNKAIVAAVFLFMGSYSYCWTPLSVLYPVEIMNFTMRARGMALNSAFIYASAFITIYVIPFGMNNLGWSFYLLTGIGINGLALIIIWFSYPETKGKSLEEIDELFDGARHTDAPNVLDMMKLRGTDQKVFELEKSGPEVSEQTV